MGNTECKLSLVIPTLNAASFVAPILKRILAQTVIPDEIVIIDSQSDDDTVRLFAACECVKVIQIARDEFDHGGTRNQAIAAASGDIILMLSQDVMPRNNDYFEKLIAPLLENENCAASTGRQIAYDSASLREKYIREFNYKEQSFLRDQNDIKRLGVKALFMSDCCAAYKKSALERVGMYQNPSLANEDMILASKLLSAGYKIAYTADAEVLHSHDYPLRKQYRRNFDIGAGFVIDHEYFENLRAEKEGVKMAAYVLGRLLRHGHTLMAAYFCIDCAVRLKAHKDGEKWRKYSKTSLQKRTMNLNYWKKIGYLE